eukprot:TRINITY_DN2106_c0_g1_i1.p3 TRINITY_DN2106_c0_g1~~TRINITY_DN2106_c0_g1_i1.p3  ORF type:complete len:192 (+),score=34.13 TRINITY_DN2106_c0_g1_i1:1586-2161(+)
MFKAPVWNTVIRCIAEAKHRSIFQKPILRCISHFDIFNLTPTFDIDLHVLETRYRALQKAIHPDVIKHTKVLRPPTCTSDEVNVAYDTLKRPLKRALYLLEVQGSAIEEGTKAVDPQLLQDTLDAREALEAGGEDAKAVARDARKKRDDAISAVTAAFRSNNVLTAKEATMRLIYATKIDDIVNDTLSDHQ